MALAVSNRGDRIATRANWDNAIIVVDVDKPHRRQLLGINPGYLITFSEDDRYSCRIGQEDATALVGKGRTRIYLSLRMVLANPRQLFLRFTPRFSSTCDAPQF